jgi:hypothetical protein
MNASEIRFQTIMGDEAVIALAPEQPFRKCLILSCNQRVTHEYRVEGNPTEYYCLHHALWRAAEDGYKKKE